MPEKPPYYPHRLCGELKKKLFPINHTEQLSSPGLFNNRIRLRLRAIYPYSLSLCTNSMHSIAMQVDICLMEFTIPSINSNKFILHYQLHELIFQFAELQTHQQYSLQYFCCSKQLGSSIGLACLSTPNILGSGLIAIEAKSISDVIELSFSCDCTKLIF